MSDESDVDLSWMLGTGIVGEDEVIPIEESLSRAQNLPDVVASDDLRADSPNDAGRTPEEETKKDDSSFGEAMDCSPPGPQGGGGECDAGDVEMETDEDGNEAKIESEEVVVSVDIESLVDLDEGGGGGDEKDEDSQPGCLELTQDVATEHDVGAERGEFGAKKDKDSHGCLELSQDVATVRDVGSERGEIREMVEGEIVESGGDPLNVDADVTAPVDKSNRKERGGPIAEGDLSAVTLEVKMEGCDPASPDSPVLSEVDSNSDRGFSPDVANQNPRDVIEKMMSGNPSRGDEKDLPSGRSNLRKSNPFVKPEEETKASPKMKRLLPKDLELDMSDTSDDGYNYYEDMYDARQDKKFGAEIWDAKWHGFTYPADSVQDTLDVLRAGMEQMALEHPEEVTDEMQDAIDDAARMAVAYSERFVPVHPNEDETNDVEVTEQINKFSDIIMKFLDKQVNLYNFIVTAAPHYDGDKGYENADPSWDRGPARGRKKIEAFIAPCARESYMKKPLFDARKNNEADVAFTIELGKKIDGPNKYKCLHVGQGTGCVVLLTQHREIRKIVESSVEYTRKRDCNKREYRDQFAKLHELLILNFWPGPTADQNVILDPTSAGRRGVPFNDYRFENLCEYVGNMWNAKAYKNGPIVPETKERPVNAISKNSIPEYYDFDKEEFLDKFKRHIRHEKDKQRERFAERYGVITWFNQVYKGQPKGSKLQSKKKKDDDDDKGDGGDDKGHKRAGGRKIPAKKTEAPPADLRRSSRLKPAESGSDSKHGQKDSDRKRDEMEAGPSTSGQGAAERVDVEEEEEIFVTRRSKTRRVVTITSSTEESEEETDPAKRRKCTGAVASTSKNAPRGDGTKKKLGSKSDTSVAETSDRAKTGELQAGKSGLSWQQVMDRAHANEEAAGRKQTRRSEAKKDEESRAKQLAEFIAKKKMKEANKRGESK